MQAEKARSDMAAKLSQSAKRLQLLPISPFPQDFSHGAPRAFRPNQPSVAHFPIDEWSRLSSRRFRKASPEMFLSGDVLGYPPLRDALVAIWAAPAASAARRTGS